MTVLHSRADGDSRNVDNCSSINIGCGCRNAHVPTFSRTYPQSTGPTTTTTLFYQ